ncbi:MAG TPA: hypothetical protein VKT30_13450 [Caulobacteraceae bacterium]|nr:hypothetical protein [Caulobacteraceae bacterium]
MAISTARFSFGSIACAVALVAVLLPAGSASAQHRCPKGSYWGRNSTLVACGKHHKLCTKYGPWHCIKRLPQPT